MSDDGKLSNGEKGRARRKAGAADTTQACEVGSMQSSSDMHAAGTGPGEGDDGLKAEADLPPIGDIRPPKGAGVGYGHPPREHRFQPGTSGNPRGRPIGAKTRRFGLHGHRLYDGLRSEIERPVKYRESGEEREMPALQAVIRQHVHKAMQGQIGSARMIVDIASQVDTYERRQNERLFESWMEYKESWQSRLRALEKNPDPEKAKEIPLPHPDHVVVDFTEGEILLKGPATEEEREALEQMWEMREKLREFLATAEEMLKTKLSKAQRKVFQEAREVFLERIAFITSHLGEDE